MDISTLIGHIIAIIVGVPSVLGIFCHIIEPIDLTAVQFICISLAIIILAIGILFWVSPDQIIEPKSTDPTELTTEPEHVAGIPLSKCTPIDNSNAPGSTTDVAVGNWEDSFGNYHADSLKFWVVDRSGWSNTEYITYQLDSKYTTLSGLVVAGSDSHEDAIFSISFYLDGTLKETSGIVTKNAEAQTYSIDVSGANEICIVCTTESNQFGYCIVTGTLS